MTGIIGDLATHVGADLRGAHEAYRLYTAAMLEFSAACMRFDWTAADEARERAEGFHVSFLDHLSAAYKRMESEH